jgi:NifU-like protein involved in Fe-S cluster formation
LNIDLMLEPAREFDYSPRVQELFANLKHAGLLAAAPNVVSAMAGSREQGASVRVWVVVRAARVQTVNYQAYGCPHFLSACESLAEWLDGRACNELSQWRWRDVEAELEIPAAKRARLLLLDEVMLELSKAVGKSA